MESIEFSILKIKKIRHGSSNCHQTECFTRIHQLKSELPAITL